MKEDTTSLIATLFGGARRFVLILLTLALIGTLAFGISVPGEVMTIISMVYAFYFGAKESEAGKAMVEVVEEIVAKTNPCKAE